MVNRGGKWINKGAKVKVIKKMEGTTKFGQSGYKGIFEKPLSLLISLKLLLQMS